MAARAEATIDAVTVGATRPYENTANYTYAEITIHGSLARADGSVGRYTVPAMVIYPRHGRGNGVGVVDWLNSAFYHFFPPTTEDRTIQFTLLATGRYLFDEGYTYVSIQWNKRVTETFGPIAPHDGQHSHLLYGTIEKSADAWEIFLDAARLLKNPSLYPGDGPAPVATVLSSGYSQGGGLQFELLAEGLDPARVYDGHLVQMIGFTCWKRDDVGPHFGSFGDCKALPTDDNHAPVIVLASETDMVAFHPDRLGFGKSAFFTRNRTNPDWRQYEMAGISHLPEAIFAVDGVSNQNSADARPLFRAAFRNLTKWTHGKHREKPPASHHFRGHVDGSDPFIPATDGDGHFAGGVRLPHVESTTDGRIAGAPLGRYTPLNFAGLDPFAFVGGTFTRFRDDDLVARYPSRHRYATRVRRAVNSLAAGGYITNEDRRALIAAARDEALP